MAGPIWYRIVLGFVVADLAGHFFIWLLIRRYLPPQLEERHRIERQKPTFAWLAGMLERSMYTGAILIGA
jgi:hypothetical protein